ncbi:MAG TPA: RIP metalloprotease RseP [Chiayiivirga sp.]|uniref:Zinc metalloprotease n=1 Tax=Denitratimonas tolerans TaxID=1338420 RepID=A0AAW9R5N6_9GAMM|nr:RIP metalloprotease RseP [Xanthomonadaceae bacterium]HRN59208.1 RIP metalloprotease RseP [Chiayiivirga sp.]HRQ34215.1 RIP metalloprotease RseP [Chiayiivirga sp.]
MSQYAGWIWWLIVSLGILVTFHEFGHYWVARRCGVKVQRFSVGFGRPIWRRTARSGTEYVVGWIPLGGYVRMLDEREGDVPEHLLSQAFNRKSVYQRIAVVAAGPIFNLILCIVLLWAMFVIGKADFLPLVGQAQGVAAQAGLRPDDRILAVDGQRVDTWTHVQMALATAAVDQRPIQLEVMRGNGDSAQLRLDLENLSPAPKPAAVLRDIGLVPRQFLLPPRVGGVTADGAAARAGLQADDRLLMVGTRSLRSWDEIGAAVQAQAREDTPLAIVFERDGTRHEARVQPAYDASADPPRWLLGISAPRVAVEYDALLRFGPIDAVGAALDETWRLTGATLGIVWRMVRGAVSLENINGPISIAQYASASAQLGLAWFLSFLAMLSLSLCIMNLLPIPILDGGHLLYYLIEMVKGSPVSERTMIAGQFVGMVLLVGLMGLAFYNDILHLVSS